MKHILKFFLLMFIMIGNVQAAITDLRLSTAQIFDVQWYVSGGRLYASSFNYIYSSVNYATQTNSAARWTAAQTSDAGSNGRYIAFFDSTTNPGTYGMAVYNSDGTRYKIINNTGSFRALADGAIFYNGNNSWGTLITTGQGYSNGGSGNWAVTQEYPTNSQLQSYTPPTTVPLASGQTATQANETQQSGGGGGSVQPTYSSDITQTQIAVYNSAKTRRDSALSNRISIDQTISSAYNSVTVEQTGYNNTVQGRGGAQYATLGGVGNTVTVRQGDATNITGKNLLEMSLTGNSNTVEINQARIITTGASDGWDSNGHIADIKLAGNSNTLRTQQTNTSVGPHYMAVEINGNNNTTKFRQIGDNSKLLWANITGSSVTVDVTQGDTGQHYLDLTTNGIGHSVTVLQRQGGNHHATINLTNSGGPSTVNLTQQGATQQIYSITQSCATLSGCSVSVTQGQ